jgi:tRNA dimethylallyltransferase
MDLAKDWPIEIISMDSALVYQGMDIGTAKPTLSEMQEVPHHLIDIRQPWQSYSAAEFAQDAHRLIPEIQSRGKIPVLVGGTFLYLKALVSGLDDLPSTSPEIRQRVLENAQAQGWPALHQTLKDIDPQTALRLSPNDAQRIGRAMEVWLMTGQTLSSLQTKRHASADGKSSSLGVCLISLEPSRREWLHERISQRFHAMLDQGFLREFLHLYVDPQLHGALPSMRCVGYRQAWDLLASFDHAQERTLQALGLDIEDTKSMGPAYFQFVQASIAATRQLAKRQLTWLRSMPERQLLHCDNLQSIAQWKAQDFRDRCMPLYQGRA